MLCLFHGSDNSKARAKAKSLIALQKKKYPEASLSVVTARQFSHSLLDQALGEQGLFFQKQIVLLDGVIGESENEGKEITDNLERLEKSPNLFVLAEGEIPKKISEKIIKHCQQSAEFPLSQKTVKRNDFALADAFGERNGQKLWVLMVEKIRNGAEAVEIHGTIFWQLKSMIMAGKTKTAEEAGMKEFSYGKSKRYAGNFSERELLDLSSRMVAIYHEAHRGKMNLKTELEKLALTM